MIGLSRDISGTRSTASLRKQWRLPAGSRWRVFASGCCGTSAAVERPHPAPRGCRRLIAQARSDPVGLRDVSQDDQDQFRGLLRRVKVEGAKMKTRRVVTVTIVSMVAALAFAGGVPQLRDGFGPVRVRRVWSNHRLPRHGFDGPRRVTFPERVPRP